MTRPVAPSLLFALLALGCSGCRSGGSDSLTETHSPAIPIARSSPEPEVLKQAPAELEGARLLIRNPGGAASSIVALPRQKAIVFAMPDQNVVRCWSPAQGREAWTQTVYRAREIVVARGSELLACAEDRGDGPVSIVLVEPKSGKVARTLTGGYQFVCGLEFSPDGKRLSALTCIADPKGDRLTPWLVKMTWEVASGRIAEREFSGNVYRMAYWTPTVGGSGGLLSTDLGELVEWKRGPLRVRRRMRLGVSGVPSPANGGFRISAPPTKPKEPTWLVSVRSGRVVGEPRRLEGSPAPSETLASLSAFGAEWRSRAVDADFGQPVGRERAGSISCEPKGAAAGRFSLHLFDPMRGGGWIVTLPNGTYACSPGADKHIVWVSGGRAYRSTRLAEERKDPEAVRRAWRLASASN